MKSWFFEGMLVAAIALPALSGAAWAGCSNATLQGDYAFSVNTWVLTDGTWVPGFVIGITTFDGNTTFNGNGTLTQTDYQESYGYPAKFSTGETGTYKVNSNCTGSALIQLNVLGVPPVTTQGGSIGLGFVISNGGQSIHGVVSEFTNPGGTGPVPPSNIHVDRVDFWKVASEQQY